MQKPKPTTAKEECDVIMRSYDSWAEKGQELSEIDISDASAADKAYVVMCRAQAAYEVAMEKVLVGEKDWKQAREKFKEVEQARNTARAAYDALRTASPAASETDLEAAEIALDRAEQEVEDAYPNLRFHSKASNDGWTVASTRQTEYYAAKKAWEHASDPIVQFFNNAADRLVRCLALCASKSPQPPDEQQQRFIETTQKKKD